MTERIITRRTVISPKILRPLNLAFLADLHDGPYGDVLPELKTADAILIAGDLVDRHHHRGLHNALAFAREVPRLAPTFVSIGNHEMLAEEDWQTLKPVLLENGATLLEDTAVRFRGIGIGGLSSMSGTDLPASLASVRALEQMEGFRLLLCHHPEYYHRVAKRQIDLTLAGHAHGGQISVFGRGVYSPGQGFLPKYTHGFYENGRLLVTRGMTNPFPYPRWGNPTELIMLRLEPGRKPGCS